MSQISALSQMSAFSEVSKVKEAPPALNRIITVTCFVNKIVAKNNLEFILKKITTGVDEKFGKHEGNEFSR